MKLLSCSYLYPDEFKNESDTIDLSGILICPSLLSSFNMSVVHVTL